MTVIKICGITNLEDTLFAVNHGADALGFNFYEKSPRRIDTGTAAELIGKLPYGIVSVGVFVNESIKRILEIAAYTRLAAIQLHGDETPEFILELKEKTGLEIIKAVRVSPGFAPRDVLKYKADAILLDAFSKDGYGGTGEPFDWTVARKVQRLVPKMYLAGGLSPDNIADAVKTVGPYAVDACSRLEKTAGKKDPRAVAAFIANVIRLEPRPVDQVVEFIVKRLNFLITRYNFIITERICNPAAGVICYKSDKVYVHAGYCPARCEYGLGFGLIEGGYEFGIADLIDTLKLDISPVETVFGEFPQAQVGKNIIGREARILEEYGDAAIRGETAIYRELHNTFDKRGEIYNEKMRSDALRRTGNAAWQRKDYLAVVNSYGQLGPLLSEAERKKLAYARGKIK